MSDSFEKWWKENVFGSEYAYPVVKSTSHKAYLAGQVAAEQRVKELTEALQHQTTRADDLAVENDKQAHRIAEFKLGDKVRKTKGSQWHGTVVGTYSTTLTPEGYAVESATEKGSVQIYPAAALEVWNA